MKAYKSSALFYLGVIWLFAIIVISGCAREENSENTIQLKQTSYDNALPPNAVFDSFNPNRHIFPVVERDSITGLPDSLKEMKVWHNFIYRDQYFYYAYKNGMWSEKGFNSMNPPINPKKQTERWVDCIATIAFGKKANNEWVFILDKNNNEDLSDDEPISFDSDTLRFQGSEMIVERAKVDLDFEIYRDNEILKKTEPFVLSYNPKEGASSIGLSYDKYRRGNWAINDQNFDVALFSFGYEVNYSPAEFTYLLVDLNKDKEFDVLPGSNESYRTDQPFNISGLTWQVDSIKSDGTKLYYSTPDTSVLPELSLRKGTDAPDFSGKTLRGNSLDLSKYKGKYVLLDFWGTWCGPCLEEIPNLKKAYTKFSGVNFEIVGISVDRDPQHVLKFIQERNMEWPQIFEEYRSEEQPISNLYGVIGYPTQYLISPDGKIVAHGLELRGERLFETLQSNIN